MVGSYLALVGLVLVAKVWQGFAFDLIGTLGAIGAAMALAIYFLMSQSQGTKRSAQAMVVWGMGVASLFWSIVLPIWNFPTQIFTTQINLQGRKLKVAVAQRFIALAKQRFVVR